MLEDDIDEIMKKLKRIRLCQDALFAVSVVAIGLLVATLLGAV